MGWIKLLALMFNVFIIGGIEVRVENVTEAPRVELINEKRENAHVQIHRCEVQLMCPPTMPHCMKTTNTCVALEDQGLMYELFTIEDTSLEAEQRCRSLGTNGHLIVKPATTILQQISLTNLEKNDWRVWLGTRRFNNQWKWISGAQWKADEALWRHSYPRPYSKLNCAVVDVRRNLWQNVQCDQKFPFVCQYIRRACRNDTDCPVGRPYCLKGFCENCFSSRECPLDTPICNKETRLCEKIMDVENSTIFELVVDKKSFRAAEEHCKNKRRNGTLAVIKDDELERKLLDLAMYPFWTGATDRDEEGIWQWVDGSEWHESESRWAMDEPAADNKKNCASPFYNNNLTLWKSVSCEEGLYNFFCAIPNDVNATTSGAQRSKKLFSLALPPLTKITILILLQISAHQALTFCLCAYFV